MNNFLVKKFAQQVCFNRMISVLYVRYPKAEPDKISIDFDYQYKLNSYMHFSFLRLKNEQLSIFLSRLKAKMNVKLEKSLKKKRISGEDISAFLVKHTTVVDKKKKLTLDIFDKSIENIFLDDCILQINENEYNIVMNPPIIHFIKLPKVLLSKCPIFPIISMEYGDIIDLNYQWFISPDKKKWIPVCSDYIFIPESSHINNFLKIKCICSKTNQVLEKISEKFITECPAQNAIVGRVKYTQDYIDDKSKFRVISYNLLANIYSDTSIAKEQIFRHCPAEFLNMDYRKMLLIKEIFNYRSDIICLQEVDSDYFYRYLSPYFSFNGYDCLFQSKDIECMEGQAIFWRKSKFKFIEDISIKSISKLVFENELICFSQIRNLIRKSSSLLQLWIKLKQCMVGCVLETADKMNRLIVANTHLYFRPDAEAIRFLQIATILINIESIKHKYSNSKVILTGDFNDSRNSSTINFVLNGTASIDNKLSNNNLNISLCHNLSFKSAYKTDFTNYTLDFSSELDYIFYDSDYLFCEKTIPMPSLNDVTADQALPNKHFPSDHLALIADLSFKD